MGTSFGSADELAAALRRAAEAHHVYEERTGQPDPDWPTWYAEFLEREQLGETPPT